MSAAARHGVAVFLADLLSASSCRLAPGPQAALDAESRAQLSRGLRLRRLTRSVLEVAASVGVRPVLLKGAGLASRLFPDQPLGRPSSDVDVLVEPWEVGRLGPALARLGLQPSTDPGLADAFSEHHHLSFSGGSGLVEVHFHLFTGFGGERFDEPAIRGRVRAGTFEGQPVGWLSPEDEFAYLAAHAAAHGFLRMSWLLDLARYTQVAPALDWEAVSALAAGARCSTLVGAALWVLESALDFPVPEAARRAFRVSRPRQRVYARAFSRARLESAGLSSHRLGGVALRAMLVDSAGQLARGLAQGLQRAARRAID